MKYQKLGPSGPEVSRITFGAWGIGGGNVWSDMSVDAAYVGSLLDAASDLGINYIDTAPVYAVGHSEEILGEALKGRRDRFVVQTKCSLNWRGEGGQFEYERDGKTVMRDHSAAAIRKDVEASLERMQLDHLDSLVVHRISKVVPVEETMGELNRMKEEGLIGAILISNSEPSDYEEYAKYGEVAGVQEGFSLLSQDKSIYFPTMQKYGAVFQVYNSLEKGTLANPKLLDNTYPAGDVRAKLKWFQEGPKAKMLEMFRGFDALCEKHGCSYANLVQAYTLAKYENINLLTGFRHIETMQDTCKAFDITLSAEEIAVMDQLAAAVKEA